MKEQNKNTANGKEEMIKERMNGMMDIIQKKNNILIEAMFKEYPEINSLEAMECLFEFMQLCLNGIIDGYYDGLRDGNNDKKKNDRIEARQKFKVISKTKEQIK